MISIIRITVPLIAVLLVGCTMVHDSNKFDRDVWLSNNDVTDTSNPRAKMTQDLLDNYLRPGIHRDSILNLLGDPYKEEVAMRLPKGIEMPDSLSTAGTVDLASLLDTVNSIKGSDDKAIDNFNNWHKEHSQPDTLMLYPVGWSTIDPKFLVIKFRPDSTAYEFWIEQH